MNKYEGKCIEYKTLLVVFLIMILLTVELANTLLAIIPAIVAAILGIELLMRISDKYDDGT